MLREIDPPPDQYPDQYPEQYSDQYPAQFTDQPSQYSSQYSNQYPNHYSDQYKTREELLTELAQLRLEVSQTQQVNSSNLDRLPQQRRLKNSLLKAGLGLALLLLGSTGIASYFSIQKLTENRHWAEHTQQVLEAINTATIGIKDADRGRRGYIITANDEFLATYQAGTQATQNALPPLRRLTIDNPAQQQRLNQLEPLIRQRFATLQRSIVLKQQDPSEQTVQIAITNQDRQLAQQVQTLLTTMKQEEQGLLAKRAQVINTSVRNTNWTVSISYILGFGLLAIIIRLLNKEIRQRQQAESIIRQTNANLGTLIQERTARLTQTNWLLQTEIQERRQAETALIQSEQYLRAIVDAEPECVKVVTADGMLLNMNAAGLAMIEADSLEQVRGQCVCPLIVSGHQQAFLAFMQQVAQGRAGILEFEIIGLKGTRRWMESHAVPLPDRQNSRVNVLAVTRDITERKQAEGERQQVERALHQAKAELEHRVQERTAELQQRSDEIQDLYNNAPCGYHSLDADGRVVRVNDTELQWLGYERQELLGKPFAELLTPQGQLKFQENFPQFKQQGWVNNLEFELICKDGSTLPVNLNATAMYDAAGQFLMSRSTLFDIRDQKQIEAALRDSEAKFRSLSESSPSGVLMTDAQGHVVYTNPRAQEICGYSFEEALGTGWTRFIHPDNLLPLLAQWEKAILQPQSLIFDEVRHVHKDGTVHYGRVKLAPLLDANGQLTGYVGTIADITKQRQIETMKNEFVSIVSHELRTPLTAIRGSLGLLANGVYDQKPEKGQKMLMLALNQTDRLVRLVSDILDLKRLESGQVTLTKQNCEAATLITQSAEAMQDLALQSHITLSITPLSISVWADADAITQTLTNLISNAIKFSPDGSTIWLSAELVEGAEGTERYVRFAVKDQGRGIPVDKIETIFGQFQQVDASDSRQKGGTGLGLSICRSIVQQHGGQIWVESVLAKGSTFYFTLPTAAESTVCS